MLIALKYCLLALWGRDLYVNSFLANANDIETAVIWGGLAEILYCNCNSNLCEIHPFICLVYCSPILHWSWAGQKPRKPLWEGPGFLESQESKKCAFRGEVSGCSVQVHTGKSRSHFVPGQGPNESSDDSICHGLYSIGALPAFG